MKTSDFNFELPQELIAQTPIPRRDASRLLVLDKDTGAWEHRHFYDLPDYLRPGDCLILNNSRVLPARLLGHRLPGGGACEILLLIDRGENTWECLVRPGKKLRTGARVSFGDGQLIAEITEELPGGNRLVHFEYEGIFLEVLDRLGKMPLPLHQGGAAGPGALPDRLLQGQRQRRRPHRRAPLHPGASGACADNGCKGGIRDTPCGAWYLPSREGGHHRGPRDAQRILRHPSGNSGSHQRDQAQRRTGYLRWHHLMPHRRELGRRGRHHDRLRRLDGHFHLSRLPVQGAGRADHQLPPAGVHPHHAGIGAGRTGTHVLAAYEEAVRQHYRFFSFGDAMFIASGAVPQA